jgi:aryl-alcohol dehydrogenase
MQISAAVVQEVGAPFTLTDIDLQEPAPDEVVVQIAGAGICHTVIAVQHGHMPFPLPGVLGHEGSGTVVEVGADVTTLAVGDQCCCGRQHLDVAGCAHNTRHPTITSKL